jgi:hypothetical protein
MCSEEERGRRECTEADKLRACARSLKERADTAAGTGTFAPVGDLIGAVLEMASVTAEAACVLAEAVERLREDLPSAKGGTQR